MTVGELKKYFELLSRRELIFLIIEKERINNYLWQDVKYFYKQLLKLEKVTVKVAPYTTMKDFIKSMEKPVVADGTQGMRRGE